MFVTHIDSIDGVNTVFAFIKSANIQAFPCGRRRSALIAANVNFDNDLEEGEGYRIPFDPEARLNTEANNRKHSSLNGYTQTYINSWERGKVSLSLAGYLFDITLSDIVLSDESTGYWSENDFGTQLVELAGSSANSTVDTIYANIVIRDTKLFEGFKTYYTGVLHNQTITSDRCTDPVLDVLINDATATDSNSYYFSGLSFSIVPLTNVGESLTTNGIYSSSCRKTEIEINTDKGVVREELIDTIISLPILKKQDGTWVVYEPARLPRIEHGDTEDSVAIKDLFLKDLTVNKTNSKVTIAAQDSTITLTGNSEISVPKLTQNGNTIPVIKLEQDSENSCWQLQFILDGSSNN